MLDSISFIGGGVMAEAIIQGLLNQKFVAPENVTVSEPRDKRRVDLKTRYGIQTTADNRAAARAGAVVVLCIKPQVLTKVLPELQGNLRDDQLLISILAGGRIATLAGGQVAPACAPDQQPGAQRHLRRAE